MKRTTWSPEEDATLREWCSKYPKGRCINIKQIRFSEPQRWGQMSAIHSKRSIYDKAWRMQGRIQSGKVSKSTRATLQADGSYKCNDCGEVVRNKQSLAAHYRSKHGAPIRDNIKRALELDRVIQSTMTGPTITKAKAVEFCPCPYCGQELAIYHHERT